MKTFYVNTSLCPFNKSDMVASTRKLIEWMQYVGISISFGGETTALPTPDSDIIGFQSGEDFNNGPHPWAWAYAWYYGGIVYRADTVTSCEKYLGILMHEIMHSLGIPHQSDDVYSIMNNQPYLSYHEQGTAKAYDLKLLGVSKGYVSVFDWGRNDSIELRDRFQFYIPALEHEGELHSAELRGWKRHDGKWFLKPLRVTKEVTRLEPAAWVENGVIEFPVFYDGNEINIRARATNADLLPQFELF